MNKAWGRRVAWALALLVTLSSSAIGTTPAHAGSGSYHCGYIVYGAIEDKYLQLGGPAGPLGCPTNVEGNADRGGRWQKFINGAVYWHPDPSIWAHALWGPIYNTWSRIGNEYNLGYPITDVTAAPDGAGRYAHFERAASVYLAPGSFYAQQIYGGIRERWAQLGWERSPLGYPITVEFAGLGADRAQLFQNGLIYWHSTGYTGATWGNTYVKWAGSCGGIEGVLGPPEPGEVPDQYQGPGGATILRNYFIKGYILYNTATGVGAGHRWNDHQIVC